MFEKETPRNGK